MTAAQTSGWAQGGAVRAVPNAFLAPNLSGSVTVMVGAGNDRPVTLVAETVVAATVDPGTVDPGTVEPGMSGPAMAQGMVAPGMGGVSRDAASQVAPGMASAQVVGANAVPLSGAAGMASVPMETGPMENVLRVIGLPAIGRTGPAAAQIGSRQAIDPDLSGVPLTAVPPIGVLLIVVLGAVPLAVLPVALVRGVLGLAGRMSPDLMEAVIGQGPVPRSWRWMPRVPQAKPNAIAMSRRPI